ncbi:hypothetical protein AC244_01665 [Ensifer adhaerens]|uniref:Uncharacterized protein n=1 Tax=Ensifer adhaerens TaxID=106592 RepID=A0A0L8C5Q2_ENSAD|nr:GcrA family cell cycle regulator [Ensifer adhaerens]KOF22282.1 hypothetical protein AC244_01665 [Ensifer adhaerens]
MSEEEGRYAVVGVVCATDDAPGLCTPVFRHEDGQRYFIQDFKYYNQIDGFEFIGGSVGGHFIDVLSNSVFGVGDPVQVGMLLPGGGTMISDHRRVLEYFRENAAQFVPYPFMFYQLAIMSRNQHAVFDAFGMQPIRDAIEKRRIPVVWPHNKKTHGRWTEEAVRVLGMLWEFYYSGTEIGRILGFSRNAVLSKAKRIKLPLRENPLKQGDLFESFEDYGFDEGGFQSGSFNLNGTLTVGKIHFG